jgi:hypothetical protein
MDQPDFLRSSGGFQFFLLYDLLKNGQDGGIAIGVDGNGNPAPVVVKNGKVMVSDEKGMAVPFHDEVAMTVTDGRYVRTDYKLGGVAVGYTEYYYTGSQLTGYKVFVL